MKIRSFLKVFVPLRNIKNLIISKISFLKLSNIKENINSYYNECKDKIHNLLPKNIELGKYHMAHNNIKDAILRFKIILKLFDKENLEAKYYLIVCYILSNQRDKAKQEISDFPDLSYKDIKLISEGLASDNMLPLSLIKEIRNLEALKYKENFYEEEYLLFLKFCQILSESVKPINQNDNIIEINSGNGYLGFALKELSGEVFYLESTDFAKKYIDITNELTNNNIRLYNNCILGDFKEILPKQDKKYNFVFSIWGLEYNNKIEESLKIIVNGLQDEGILAFTIHMEEFEEEFKLTSNSISYIFGKKYLENVIERLKNLKIIIIKKVDIKSIRGYIVIAQKIKIER